MIIDQQLTVNSHLISLRVDNDVGINIKATAIFLPLMDGSKPVPHTEFIKN